MSAAGCATHTPELSSSAGLTAFKPITASPADTCPTQREIAEHNSAYDTLKNGKQASYKADCDLTKKPSKAPVKPGTPDAKVPKLS